MVKTGSWTSNQSRNSRKIMMRNSVWVPRLSTVVRLMLEGKQAVQR